MFYAADFEATIFNNLIFSLLKVQRKIYIANKALEYFMVNEWILPNKNLFSLLEGLPKQDLKSWDFDFTNLSINEYIKDAKLGAKTYLLNEKMEDLPAAKKRYQRYV